MKAQREIYKKKKVFNYYSQSYPHALSIMNTLTANAITGRSTTIHTEAKVTPMSRYIVLCIAISKKKVATENKKFRNRCTTCEGEEMEDWIIFMLIFVIGKVMVSSTATTTTHIRNCKSFSVLVQNPSTCNSHTIRCDTSPWGDVELCSCSP